MAYGSIFMGGGLIIFVVCATVVAMKKIKNGRVNISALNVPPEKHEYSTAKYFADRGMDVIFIRPSSIKGQNNPDFKMGGKIWETKSIISDNANTLKRRLNQASKQSANIIIDLRRVKARDEKRFIQILNKQSVTPNIKTLLTITKSGNLLTIKGKFGNIKV